MEKITKQVLSNGLTLVHKQVEPLPIVGIRLFIKLGSINEPAELAGITHLTQILMLKGTKTRAAEQIAIDLESVGGSIGSDSTEDYSEVSVSITSKHFKKAVELLSDIVMNPVFPEQELEKEKSMTLAGIKSRKDTIFNVAVDLLMENLYGKHPYARLTVGTEESVNKITRDDIISWYKKNYGVSNMLVVVVGNVSLSDTKKYLEQYFSGLQKGIAVTRDIPVPELKESKVVVEPVKFEQAYLMYGYLAGEVSSADYTGLKIIDAYLGGGMSSELFQRLREQAGLGYEVDAFYPSRMDKSRFVIYIGLDKSSIGTSKEKITEILNEIKQKPLSTVRFNEIKTYLKGIYLLDHQTASRQAWYYGWWEMLNKGFEYDTKYTDELDKITPDDIVRIANKYFTDKFVCVELQPVKK